MKVIREWVPDGFTGCVKLVPSYHQGLSTKRTSSKMILIGDFTGGPVVKTSPYNADGMGLIPGWGAKISHASRPKKKKKKQNKT